MSTSSDICTGYALPFKTRVPRRIGFFRGGRIDVFATLRAFERESARRLERALSVFLGLANTGALCGADIPPSTSGCILLSKEQQHDLRFRFSLTECRIDDRAIVVLAHLLFTQRKWLSLETLSVSVVDTAEYVDLRQDANEISTYPTRCSQIPFQLVDEQPEGQAVTFEVEFEQPPAAVTLNLLDRYFGAWSDAILRGAYSLAPFPPEESHVESYDSGFVVVGNVAERSYHKLEADDAVIDAALNIFASLHDQCQKIKGVTIT